MISDRSSLFSCSLDFPKMERDMTCSMKRDLTSNYWARPMICPYVVFFLFFPFFFAPLRMTQLRSWWSPKGIDKIRFFCFQSGSRVGYPVSSISCIIGDSAMKSWPRPHLRDLSSYSTCRIRHVMFTHEGGWADRTSDVCEASIYLTSATPPPAREGRRRRTL